QTHYIMRTAFLSRIDNRWLRLSVFLPFCLSFGYVTPIQAELNPSSLNTIHRSHENLQPRAEVSVSGRVTDSQGGPIPGVTVSVQGTSIGTATDMDGYYALVVPEGSILVFSFIGYETQTHALDGRSVLDVMLIEDMASLEEVVVIGYMTQRKADLTGAVAVVSEEDIRKNNFSNVLQSLQGKVPGMYITGDGNPVGNVNVQIRGLT